MNSRINFSVNECINTLIDKAQLLAKTEYVDLFEARNRVLARQIDSSINVPPTDKCAIDGYAINIADYSIGGSYKVNQRIASGSTGTPLSKGTAAQVSIGAEIPKNANAIIKQNQSLEKLDLVTFQAIPKVEENIRRRGNDISKGQTVILAGTRLRPQEIGMLASIGISKVKVYKPLTIGLVSTVNKLVEPGNKINNDQLYNANRYLVDSVLREWGFNVVHECISNDTLKETKTKLLSLTRKCDTVLSIGGISINEGEKNHDIVKQAVLALGDISVPRVVVKPGKPFAFGNIKNTPFIGLPGNPSSTFVTLLMLTRPFLFASQGRKQKDLTAVPVRLRANIMRHVISREEYLRCRLSERGLEIHPNQSNGVLSSIMWGNCLLKHKAGTEITPKKLLEVYLYRDLLY